MAIDKSDSSTRTLVNHWVRGEGAAKIRWGTDGSFDRCVRALSDKVRDPEGLCAELHKEATGEWPAEKGVESALSAETFDQLGEDPVGDEFSEHFVRDGNPVQDKVITWSGIVAPVDRPTGDGREFAAGALDHREFPLPAMFQIQTGSGHGGSVTVASLDRLTELPGIGWRGEGQFLDPRIVPEVTRAIYLISKRLARPSVDLEPTMTYELVSQGGEDDSGNPLVRITQGRVAGVTFVAKPAFADLTITVHDEAVGAVLASAGIEFAVNAAAWQKMPLAARDQAFDADDAIARLTQLSGGDPAVFGRAFLWRQTDGDPRNKASYRLPIADVINGKMTLVPHAVYAAAAILSGAHGGLPNVPDDEKEQIRKVITEIYDVLRETFADPRVMPPWQRGGRRGAEGTGDAGMGKNEAAMGEVTVNEVEGMFTITERDEGSAFGQALTAATSSGYRPPADWFRNPALSRPTALTVTEQGRVYGHLASWNVCHTGIGNRCVMAPHSVTDYAYFKVGSVITDDGAAIRVGKITLGGGHADPQYGIRPALEHYDNAATAVAAINVGEDGHGIWVAGALLPGVDETRLTQLRLSPLSGDWRRANGNLELIAALAVNTPGFPVLRASAEQDETLLAAGVVDQPRADSVANPDPGQEKAIRLRDIAAFLDTEQRARKRERFQRTAS